MVVATSHRIRTYQNSRLLWGNAIADRIWRTLDDQKASVRVTVKEDETLLSGLYTHEELRNIEDFIINRAN